MLRYVGNGFLAGVPARDLSDEEVKIFDEEVLARSGLYEAEENVGDQPRLDRSRKVNQKEVKDA